MVIRKANIEDSQHIATYLLMAMEDIIYSFIGKRDYKEAKAFLLHFIEKRDNQYSYQNCLVAEDNNEIIGAVNVYDGALLTQLRSPVMEYLHASFGMNFIPEPETQSGEIYIDSLAVHPEYRGKGIGKRILRYLIDEYTIQRKQTLGLLVEEDNLLARKLYINLGFKPAGKKILVGKHLEHLQIKG